MAINLNFSLRKPNSQDERNLGGWRRSIHRAWNTRKMNKHLKGGIYFLLFLIFLLPLLSVLNCEGWNAGSMAFKSCTYDTPFLREFGNTVIGWAYVASFMAGIPILIYFAIVAFPLWKIFRLYVPKKEKDVQESPQVVPNEKVKISFKLLVIPINL